MVWARMGEPPLIHDNEFPPFGDMTRKLFGWSAVDRNAVIAVIAVKIANDPELRAC